MKYIRVFLIAILLLLVIGNSVLAVHDDHAIHKAIMASGGDTRGSEQYRTQDIIGQTAAGSSSSEHYALHAGFYSPFRA